MDVNIQKNHVVAEMNREKNTGPMKKKMGAIGRALNND